MIKPLGKGDITVRPHVVYKTWVLSDSATGIVADEGLQVTSSIFDTDTAEQNSSGNYKRSVYDLFNWMFYEDYANSATNIGASVNVDLQTRILHDRINVISIPNRYVGERIRPGSVTITDNSNGVAKIYVDDSSGSLYDQASPSVHVGNIFYQQGFITCTHTGSYYSSSFLETGVNGFSVQFDSTITLQEYEIVCTILPGEFNVSTNPTAVTAPATGSLSYDGAYDDIVDSEFVNYEYSSSNDTTGSFLSPFATTIGFYDSDLTLLAVAKFPVPLKILPDYTINVIARFDT